MFRDYGFLKSAATIIPHPDKAYKGGEDSFMMKSKMIAVADGVGGWANVKWLLLTIYREELM